VAISPDVVSVFYRYFRPCDLLWSSGVRDVARKASSVSPTAGMATPSRLAEALSPPPASRLLVCSDSSAATYAAAARRCIRA
jgi:hypothetical protein